MTTTDTLTLYCDGCDEPVTTDGYVMCKLRDVRQPGSLLAEVNMIFDPEQRC